MAQFHAVFLVVLCDNYSGVVTIRHSFQHKSKRPYKQAWTELK